MKKVILILIGVLLLHGCSLVNNQKTEVELTNTAAITARLTPTPEPIPALETNPKETIALPAPYEYTDADNFILDRKYVDSTNATISVYKISTTPGNSTFIYNFCNGCLATSIGFISSSNKVLTTE